MKNKEEVIEKLYEILKDNRFWYETATVRINAPLALIQISLESRFDAFCWVLNIKVADAKSMWKKWGKVVV